MTVLAPPGDDEGHLETATGFDISGSRPDALARSFVREVTERPRLDLDRELGDRLAGQAVRLPRSAAGRLVRDGLRDRLDRYPLDHEPPPAPAVHR